MFRWPLKSYWTKEPSKIFFCLYNFQSKAHLWHNVLWCSKEIIGSMQLQKNNADSSYLWSMKRHAHTNADMHTDRDTNHAHIHLPSNQTTLQISFASMHAAKDSQHSNEYVVCPARFVHHARLARSVACGEWGRELSHSTWSQTSRPRPRCL